jgi:hypothetical protein
MPLLTWEAIPKRQLILSKQLPVYISVDLYFKFFLVSRLTVLLQKLAALVP